MICGGGATRSANPTRPARRTSSRAQVASLLPQTPHTARSPFLLVWATHAPISTLNTCADTLAVASAARSAAVNVEIGRVDAPSDFWSTLATCTSSTVGAAAAGTARLRVACARQACAGARPGAQASALHARRPARHRWLSGRPRSRAQASRKRERLCGHSVAVGGRLECWSCRRSRGRPWLGWAVPMWVTALSRGAWTAFRGS